MKHFKKYLKKLSVLIEKIKSGIHKLRIYFKKCTYNFYNYLSVKLNIRSKYFFVLINLPFWFAVFYFVLLPLPDFSFWKVLPVALATDVGLIISLNLLEAFISRFFSNTGGYRWTFPGKYLLYDKNKKVFHIKIDTEDTDVKITKYAVSSDIDLVAKISHDGYKNTVWDSEIEDKKKRYAPHIDKIDKCILLTQVSDADTYQVLTYILPVSYSTWNKYLNAEIRDTDFSAELIAEKLVVGKTSNDINEISKCLEKKPYGLILFSIAHNLPKNFKKGKKAGSVIEYTLAKHLKDLIDEYFKDFYKVPVLLQNMDYIYKKFFEKASIGSVKISKDGARIFIFEILK